MDQLYTLGPSTVNQVLAGLPDPPSDKSVRGLLDILERKSHVRRRKRGREWVYSPTKTRKQAGRQAFMHLLDTFFDGSLDQAVASHLESPKTRVSQEEIDNLKALIEKTRQDGR